MQVNRVSSAAPFQALGQRTRPTAAAWWSSWRYLKAIERGRRWTRRSNILGSKIVPFFGIAIDDLPLTSASHGGVEMRVRAGWSSISAAGSCSGMTEGRLALPGW